VCHEAYRCQPVRIRSGQFAIQPEEAETAVAGDSDAEALCARWVSRNENEQISFVKLYSWSVLRIGWSLSLCRKKWQQALHRAVGVRTGGVWTKGVYMNVRGLNPEGWRPEATIYKRERSYRQRVKKSEMPIVVMSRRTTEPAGSEGALLQASF